MADIVRGADAVWHGTLKEGNGQITTDSGTLNNTPFTFVSRFETGSGTNPEELIAAAHAGCYSMQLGSTLSNKGFSVQDIHTRADVTLSAPQPGGRRILKIVLTTRGKVTGIDNATFVEIAREAEQQCIIANALRAVPMELDAALE